MTAIPEAIERSVMRDRKAAFGCDYDASFPLTEKVRSTNRLAHFEAAANCVIGIVLAQLVLLAFGVPLHEAVVLNAVMIGVSYARSFVLRVVFARWAR